jgi:hypothetical protein
MRVARQRQLRAERGREREELGMMGQSNDNLFSRSTSGVAASSLAQRPIDLRHYPIRLVNWLWSK